MLPGRLKTHRYANRSNVADFLSQRGGHNAASSRGSGQRFIIQYAPRGGQQALAQPHSCLLYTSQAPPPPQYARPRYAPARPPAPAYKTPTGPVTLAQGTLLQLRTSEPVASKKAKDGEPVQFTVIQDVAIGGVLAIPRGATVHGVISEDKKACLLYTSRCV